MLYPQNNRFRSAIDLSGFWRFRPDPDNVGYLERWYQAPLPADGTRLIAVPGAWNEQLAEAGLMNFIGKGWYETTLVLRPAAVRGTRLWLYVGAADHRAECWLNGRRVGVHVGGFVPFQVELTDAWTMDGPNRLTVCVDSTLTLETLPQDVAPTMPPYDTPDYDRRHLYPPTRFDFFPYGGLTRSVQLVTTAPAHLDRLSIDARLDGAVTVHAETTGVSPEGARVGVRLFDAAGHAVADGEAPLAVGQADVELHLESVQPWCPADPTLYTAEVRLLDADGGEVDGYDETFGVREVRVEGDRLLLNSEPLYLVGFGKHEEFPVVGRGQFRAAYLRDYELMRWSGANSYRTSHYPYDEEFIRLADRLGFLVIGEVPAVSLGFWTDDMGGLQPLLENHKQALTDLIERDRNRPSVIAWSMVNEANLWEEAHYVNGASRRYFRQVYDHARALDATRPVMAIVSASHSVNDVALEACDLIGINRYFGWYTEPADLAHAVRKLSDEMDALYARYGKPIMLAEFGADTVAGVHSTTAQLFTEEYQEAFLLAYCRLLDALPYCIGTHVWNFADFRTPQHYRRVVHNLKGVFTRSREPKRAAFALREHWRTLTRIAPTHRPTPSPDGPLVPDIKVPVVWPR